MVVGEAGEQVAVVGLADERRFEADAADIDAEGNHGALKHLPSWRRRNAGPARI